MSESPLVLDLDRPYCLGMPTTSDLITAHDTRRAELTQEARRVRAVTLRSEILHRVETSLRRAGVSL